MWELGNSSIGNPNSHLSSIHVKVNFKPQNQKIRQKERLRHGQTQIATYRWLYTSKKKKGFTRGEARLEKLFWGGPFV